MNDCRNTLEFSSVKLYFVLLANILSSVIQHLDSYVSTTLNVTYIII